jgi:hypothetical protein
MIPHAQVNHLLQSVNIQSPEYNPTNPINTIAIHVNKNPAKLQLSKSKVSFQISHVGLYCVPV